MSVNDMRGYSAVEHSHVGVVLSLHEGSRL